MTILHWGVYNRHLKALKVILKYFSKKLKTEFISFINQKDKRGFTALHYAVDRGKKGSYTTTRLQILTTLLEYAGDAIKTTDKNGRNILHWAVANNNLEAVKAIVRHAQSTLTSQAYQEFIQMKTFINKTTGEGGCTAIYWTVNPEPEYFKEDKQSADAKRVEIFNVLLPEYEINDTDGQGQTIAHWVVAQGDTAMLKILIEHQADLSIQDQKGRTVLHTAIETIASACLYNNLGLIESFTGADGILDQLLSLKSSMIGCHKKDNFGYRSAKRARKLKLTDAIIKRLEEKEESHLPLKKRVRYRTS